MTSLVLFAMVLAFQSSQDDRWDRLRNELLEFRLAGRPGFRMKRNSEARERKQQQYAAAGKAPLAHTKDYSTERARIEGGPSLREI